jgi:hypothetical protein
VEQRGVMLLDNGEKDGGQFEVLSECGASNASLH